MLTKVRIIKAVLLGALLSVVSASVAFAQTTPMEDVETAVQGTFDDLTSFAVAAIPWLLGLAVIGIAIRFGLKLLAKAR